MPSTTRSAAYSTQDADNIISRARYASALAVLSCQNETISVEITMTVRTLAATIRMARSCARARDACASLVVIHAARYSRAVRYMPVIARAFNSTSYDSVVVWMSDCAHRSAAIANRTHAPTRNH